MKALPKKRKHQSTRNFSVQVSAASMLKFQAAWYSAFIAVYIWFLYWISYDFFVWHKPIAEINVMNYVGSVAAIVFMWTGAKMLKRDRIKAESPQQKLLPPKPLQRKPPQKAALTAVPVAAPATSTCNHHLGYLNQRQKQQEIPSECLTCEHVIKCMSSAN